MKKIDPIYLYISEKDGSFFINILKFYEDICDYESYMKSMENKKIERDQLRDTVREINTLKCEMHEIKSLLIQLMDKK